MSDTLEAHATVKTQAAARYVKQLASHLGRRTEPVEGPEGTSLLLGGGRCLLVATEETLILRASAPTSGDLERVKNVVGAHLERFGRRDDLTVHWS
ncbi:DUF2218 domain-containing protein [Parafrankia discariae]|uniref:DUF2218 domain-containing protein n=1 Tax=Parafrankia discariae TaxID=365528 RepID=UPI00039C7053|nr:DUF2218 domain-containing protein [Parafrankia discariae]